MKDRINYFDGQQQENMRQEFEEIYSNVRCRTNCPGVLNAVEEGEQEAVDRALRITHVVEDADMGFRTATPALSDVDMGIRTATPALVDANMRFRTETPAPSDADMRLRPETPALSDADIGFPTETQADANAGPGENEGPQAENPPRTFASLTQVASEVDNHRDPIAALTQFSVKGDSIISAAKGLVALVKKFRLLDDNETCELTTEERLRAGVTDDFKTAPFKPKNLLSIMYWGFRG